MNPADERPIQNVFEIQGAMLRRHEEDLVASHQTVKTLASRCLILLSPSPGSVCLSLPSVKLPSRFSPTPMLRRAVAHIISLLKGRARFSSVILSTPGKTHGCDFSVGFRTLSTSCDWIVPVLVVRFVEGLNAGIRDEVLAREIPLFLDPLIDLALRVEKRFDLRCCAHAPVSSAFPPATGGSSSAPTADQEPMQLGAGCRTPASNHQPTVSVLGLGIV
ncbi:hypothetical protein F2P79_019103 [Pimephales promelas]|nr:hypothetical protein F2P79_019103 [Pimephales promelas]